ncbi:MAG: hypothetical protein ACHQ50_18195 [Fimbriimonadales bacterium]
MLDRLAVMTANHRHAGEHFAQHASAILCFLALSPQRLTPGDRDCSALGIARIGRNPSTRPTTPA